MYNLSKEPYPLDRDPGKSFLPRERGGGTASRVLPLPPHPPAKCLKFLCQGLLATYCAVLVLRLEEAVCLAGSPQVYIGHVNKPPRACSAVVVMPRPEAASSPACLK